MTNLHDITNKALEQWISVTDVDPENECWTWGEYEIQQINTYIRSAQDLDPTGLTAFMVVRAVARDYIRSHKFNALDLVDEDDRTLERIMALRKLAQMVETPEAIAAVVEFQDQLLLAADHYGVRTKVEETIKDMGMLSHIRRDALICTSLLERHTFALGQRAKGPLTYNRTVIKLWNMNSLIRMAEAQPVNGISIVLVRDPQYAAYSFFCFLVRDGENITIWTDQDKQAHPMAKAKSRSRRQTRQLHDRAARLRFPYQLLDVSFDDEGKNVHDRVGTELVRTNTKAVPISAIEDLEPDQLLWALMALDVLTRAKHSPKLSVTGEAMTLQLAPGQSRVLPKTLAPTKSLSHADVGSQNINPQLKGRSAEPSTGKNNWMEARYKGLVDPRLYNLTDVLQPKAKMLGSWETPSQEAQTMVLLGGERIDDANLLLPKARGIRHKGAIAGRDQVNGPELIGLDPVAFGSPAEMEADRLWVARWNQAQALAMAAQAEFDARRDEVRAWFEDRVKQNAEQILDRIMQGKWEIDTGRSHVTWDGKTKPLIDSFIQWYRQHESWPLNSSDHWPSNMDVQCLLVERVKNPSRSDPHRCFITGMAANCWAKLLPSTPEGIAALAGVKLDELPELLEFWNPNPPYGGNSILYRTDPLDTEVSNPWAALTFQVTVGLAKREWNRRTHLCVSPGEIPWQTRKDGRWG